jgi:hemerythrin
MSKTLIWKEEWDTGITVLDEQHMEMTRKLNQIIEILSQPEGGENQKQTLEGVLIPLKKLFREHFNEEEEEMRRLNYPGYVTHKKEHVIFLAELAQLIREIQLKRLNLDTYTPHDLKHWFVSHMVIADKAFANYCLAME